MFFELAPLARAASQQSIESMDWMGLERTRSACNDYGSGGIHAPQPLDLTSANAIPGRPFGLGPGRECARPEWFSKISRTRTTSVRAVIRGDTSKVSRLAVKKRVWIACSVRRSQPAPPEQGKNNRGRTRRNTSEIAISSVAKVEGG